MKSGYKQYVEEINTALRQMKVTAAGGRELSQEEGIQLWIEKAKEIRDIKKGVFFFAGNGASATMAEHMSHDCFQNADMMTMTCSETSHITAISNDLSYEEVFAYRIGKALHDTDMLITISASGNSPNIVRALETAKEKNIYAVTLSAMGEDNRSRKLGDLNFYVPAHTYGMAESAHATLIHGWLDLFLDQYMGGRH